MLFSNNQFLVPAVTTVICLHIFFQICNRYALITWVYVYSHIFCLKTHIQGFPGGAVVKNPPANAGDMGSSPGLGRSHMPRSNQAREPQLLSLRVWSLCSATREAMTVRPTHCNEEWSPLAATRESPRTEMKTQHSQKERKKEALKNKNKNKKTHTQNILQYKLFCTLHFSLKIYIRVHSLSVFIDSTLFISCMVFHFLYIL